jgi:non-ribosomal peptide synthetase component F
LALRNQPKSSLTIADFIRNVRHQTIDAFDNKLVQFERLIDLLNVPRDPSRNPVFDVRFDVHNMEPSSMKLNGLNVVAYEPEFKTSKFDLTFDVFESNGQLQVRLEYCTRLFKAATIEEFLALYRQITAHFVEHETDLIGHIITLENTSDSHIPEMGFAF